MMTTIQCVCYSGCLWRLWPLASFGIRCGKYTWKSNYLNLRNTGWDIRYNASLTCRFDSGGEGVVVCGGGERGRGGRKHDTHNPFLWNGSNLIFLNIQNYVNFESGGSNIGKRYLPQGSISNLNRMFYAQ